MPKAPNSTDGQSLKMAVGSQLPNRTAIPEPGAVPNNSSSAADPISDRVSSLMNLDGDAQPSQAPVSKARSRAQEDAQPPEDTQDADDAPVVVPTPQEKTKRAKVELDDGIPSDVMPTEPDGEPVIDQVDDTDPELADAGDGDDDAPPEVTRDPKAAHAWKKTKDELKQAKQRLQDVEAKLKQKEENPMLEHQVLTDLQQKLQKAEERIGQLDVTQTQAFQERYDGRLRAAFEKGVGTLVRTGADTEHAKQLMTQLLQADQNTFENLLGDQPMMIQGALFQIATEYSQLAEERQKAVSNWKETKAAMDMKQRQNTAIQLAQDIERDTQAAVAEVQKSGNWMFQRSASNPAWNEQVDKLELTLKGVVKTAEPKDLIKLVAEGLTAAPLRAEYMKTRAAFKKLQAELDEVVGSTPRVGTGAPRAPRAATSNKVVGPQEFIEASFGSEPNSMFRR